MEIALCAAGSGLGLAFGSLTAGFQHLLYRNPEHRENPATGRKLLLMRVLLGLACAVIIALALRPGHYDTGPALLTAAFGVILAVIASTDFERRIIPNRLSYPAIVAALVFCWAWPDRTITDVLIGGAVALGLGGLLFFIGLFVGGAGGALGLGDVKLAVLIGLIVGWPLVTTALIFGVVLAGIPAFALMLAGKGKGYFSYGPYLVAGALIVMLWPGRFL
jgi:leader peptidase (prepilin peptidase)/N-methyltransferase